MAYAGIALLFALIILFLPRSGTRKPEIPADKAGPSRVEQARPDSNARKAAEQSEPPLVLEVPRETPIATDVYIVVKGDTLWNISARFTGNPFNYPRIAGENRIANPDLIFPGQRIRLMKKP
jgi:nucleoid-associated protein YgaU